MLIVYSIILFRYFCVSSPESEEVGSFFPSCQISQCSRSRELGHATANSPLPSNALHFRIISVSSNRLFAMYLSLPLVLRRASRTPSNLSSYGKDHYMRTPHLSISRLQMPHNTPEHRAYCKPPQPLSSLTALISCQEGIQTSLLRRTRPQNPLHLVGNNRKARSLREIPLSKTPQKALTPLFMSLEVQRLQNPSEKDRYRAIRA